MSDPKLQSRSITARLKGAQKGKQKRLPQAEYLASLKAKGHCMHCNRHGHKTEDCHKLKAERKKKSATARVASDTAVLCAQTHDVDDEPIRLFKTADKLAKRGDLINRWLIDLGASRTMSSHWDWFQAYSQLEQLHKVWLGDNTFIQAHGISRIPIHMRADRKWNKVVL